MTDEKKKPDQDEVSDEQLEDVAGGLKARTGQSVPAESTLTAEQGHLPELSPEGEQFVASLSPDQKSALKGIVGDSND